MNNDQFKISHCETGDGDEIFALEGKCFDRPLTLGSIKQMIECSDTIFLKAVVYSKFENNAEFFNKIANGKAATDGESEQKVGQKIVGYISLKIAIDEGEIYNIAVEKSARGRGLGSDLLNNALKEAKKRNAKKVFLEVNQNNNQAISLYLKNGFKQIHIRKNYYGSDSALILVKEI